MRLSVKFFGDVERVPGGVGLAAAIVGGAGQRKTFGVVSLVLEPAVLEFDVPVVLDSEVPQFLPCDVPEEELPDEEPEFLPSEPPVLFPRVSLVLSPLVTLWLSPVVLEVPLLLLRDSLEPVEVPV